MALIDKDLDILEAYFNETLTDSERLELEQRLQTDKDFREEMIQYRRVSEALKVVKRRGDVAFLKEVNAAMPPLPKPIFQLDAKWWAMAAVGLLLFTVGIWQFWGSDTEGVQMKSSVAKYFETYPSLNTTKGIEEKDKKTAAFAAYDAQKYKTAAHLFESAFVEKGDSMLLFYKGIAELGAGNATKAQVSLEKLQNSSIIPQQALSFYLGLAAAEKGETEKAVLNLKKALDTEGVYQEAAKNALTVLEGKK